jgi:DNA-binding GntR family transcriptional regulator
VPAAARPKALPSVKSRFAPYMDPRKSRTRGMASIAVTDVLREAILDGVIPPRAWLREAELADELGVSRTPVRDALRTLSSEGLVEISANKGAMVSPITSHDIIELSAIRETLEGLAARLAAKRAEHGDAVVLRGHLDHIRTALEEGRLTDVPALDLALHREIRRIADNRYVGRTLEQIESAVRRFRSKTYLNTGRPEESLREHEEIAEAIIAGDAETAERRAADHMRRVAELRIRALLDGY